MAWQFTSDRPVYLQIAERITRAVLADEYHAGDQLPSVRQLAMEAAVNPNTVQHAFSHLEQEGLILARGTTGRYVTEDKQIIENCREQMAKQLVREFADRMAQLSISRQQAIEMLAWD